MRIGVDIDYKEFLRIRDKIQNGHLGIDEREILQVRYGDMLLEAIGKETLTPNWHCKNCKSDFASIGEMTSCPKCYTDSLEYIGPPRIGYELPIKKVTRLPEAGRSKMSGGGQQTNPMFVLCPEDHYSSMEYKEERQGYHLYFCGKCNGIRARKRKVFEAVK